MRDGEREERLNRGREEGIGVSIFLYIKYNFMCAFPCSVRSLSFVVSHFSFHPLYIFFLNIFMHFFSSTKDFFSCIIYFFSSMYITCCMVCNCVCISEPEFFFILSSSKDEKKTFKLCHIHSRIFFSSHLNLHSVLYIFFV